MKTILPALLLLLFFFQGILLAQQSAPPAPLPEPAASAPPVAHNDKKAIPRFLILGTIFNQNSLAFPGVLVRGRKKGDKKFRWQTYTNSRGEFAVRVPDGNDYEVVIHVKEYQDQIEQVKTDIGDTQQRLSIRLALLHPEPTGAKP